MYMLLKCPPKKNFPGLLPFPTSSFPSPFAKPHPRYFTIIGEIFPNETESREGREGEGEKLKIGFNFPGGGGRGRNFDCGSTQRDGQTDRQTDGQTKLASEDRRSHIPIRPLYPPPPPFQIEPPPTHPPTHQRRFFKSVCLSLSLLFAPIMVTQLEKAMVGSSSLISPSFKPQRERGGIGRRHPLEKKKWISASPSPLGRSDHASC